MSERTIGVAKENGDIWLASTNGDVIRLPESEIDAIMEDIKNLR